MPISAQELNVILSARDKQFTKAMEKAQRRVEKFGERSNKALTKTSKSFSALGAAAKRVAPLLAAAFGAQAVRGVLQTATQIGQLSRIAGVSVERFQELAFAGQAFGVSQEKMADILKDVNDKFGDFVSTGAGPLKDFFEQIAPKVGLTVESFKGLSSEQVLGKYVSALEDANVSQAQMVFFMEAIASDASRLTGAFAANGKQLGVLSKQVRAAGGVMSEELVGRVTEASNEFRLLGEVLSTTVMASLHDLIPVATSLLELFTDIAGSMAGTNKQARNLAQIAGLTAKIKDNDDEILERAGQKGQESQVQRLEEDKKRLRRQIAFLKREVTGSVLTNTADANIAPPPSFNRPVPRDKPSGFGAADDKHVLAAKRSLSIARDLAVERRRTEDAIKNVTGTYNTLSASLVPEIAAEMSGAREEAEALAKTGEMFAGQLSSAFGEIIKGTQSVEQAFRTMAANIISQLIEIEMQKMMGGGAGGASPLGALLNAAGGFLTSLMGGADGGGGDTGQVAGLGYAGGGPINAGQAATVGEHGRELFVPATAGRILSVPQAKAAVGGGPGVAMQQTINVTTGVQQTVRAEVMAMMPVIREASTMAVLDARRRGGSFAGSFR